MSVGILKYVVVISQGNGETAFTSIIGAPFVSFSLIVTTRCISIRISPALYCLVWRTPFPLVVDLYMCERIYRV